MASPCIYTYKGKEYTYAEFRAALADGLLKELTDSGAVNVGMPAGVTKTLKLGERILNSENVSEEIKSGLKKKGVEYIPVNLDVTQADAKAYVKAFDDIGELDKAMSNVTDMSNNMSGINRAAIGKELFETLADKAKSSENIEEQQKLQNKAVDIAEFTAQNFRAAGQEINAAKAWKRMLEKTPEGAIVSIKKKMNESNTEALKSHVEDIRSAKDIIDEFIGSDEFKKIVGEKIKSEVEKLSKKSPKKENIFNSKSVRDARLEELRERAKKAKGAASASIIGLNKEQIEIYGEMGMIHLIDGAYKFKQWANKMKKEDSELSLEQLEEIWNKVKLSKELDSQERTLSDFSKEGLFDAMSPEVKKDLLNKFDKRLSKLKPESRKKLLANSLEEIEKLGGLSDQKFKDLYAKELGLPTLTPEAESNIRNLTKRINKADSSAKELIDAIDSGASKDEIKAKQKQWENDVFDGQKANAELSEYFKGEKTLGTTLSTILQGNLLTSLSLVKNIYSNSLIQPLRFASRGIASATDYVMAKAQTLPIMNKLIKEGRTVDALAYWKGESKGVMPGLKGGFNELIKGINPEEMIERDFSQQLEPLKSMVKFYEGLTGKEKQTAYQQLNNFTEATFGAPAEAMFRLLNLGDKPFRKAAEFGAAYEIGTLKGLKGKELDKFILFPDSASAELIKQRAEKSVYQQAEGLAKVAQQGLKSVETYVSELPVIGDVAKIVFKSQIPYVKTPLNILGETVQYALPEYSAAKAIYFAVKGDRRQALEYFGKAVAGAGIRMAVQSMVQNNLVTPSPDKKDIESIAIQNQNIPGNSLNITAVQRMMSGGDPATRPSDVWVNYNNMGVVGMLINVHANKIGVEDKDRSYLSDLFTASSSVAQSAIEQSFLQGANTFLESITGDDRSKRKWAINTLGALGSIVYPNVLATSSKASDEYIRNTKASMFSDEIINTFKTKMFMGGDLPTKVSLWGESVKGAPEGKSKFIWYTLNVTKGKQIDADSYNFKIYDLWNSIKDDKVKSGALPSIPRDYITVDKEKVQLDPKLYEEYQMIVGRNRASLVDQYTNSPNWEADNEETKIKTLKALYEEGASNGKDMLVLNHPELKPTNKATKKEKVMPTFRVNKKEYEKQKAVNRLKLK